MMTSKTFTKIPPKVDTSTIQATKAEADNFRNIQKWLGGRFTVVVVQYEGRKHAAYIFEDVVNENRDALPNRRASTLVGQPIRGPMLVDMSPYREPTHRAVVMLDNR